MPDRPYFHAGFAELSQLAETRWDDIKTLLAVGHELSFRTTIAARQLAGRVEARVSELLQHDFDVLQHRIDAVPAQDADDWTGADGDEEELDSIDDDDTNTVHATSPPQVSGVRTRTTSDEREALDDVLSELDSLIGLGHVKREVKRLADFVTVRQRRMAEGFKGADVTLHVVFLGNPGTGKTVIARLLARVYAAIGVLRKGHLVEADRSTLVASIVGGTALKVQAVVQQALGGVLFIDEAYSLASQADMNWDFGREAIDTLLKAMEDHRDELVVIAAGYPQEMKTFLLSNPGLASRFNNRIQFEDYSWEELLRIFEYFCDINDYVLSPEAASYLAELLTFVCESRDRFFGNARFVRNLFDEAVRNHASRVVKIPGDVDALLVLEACDIPDPASPSFPEA